MQFPIRYDWTLEELKAIYHMPLPNLIYQANCIHRHYHDPLEVQVCHLISIKTGGCPENCHYCPQSAHYQTGVQPQPLMAEEEVLKRAKSAIENGATRICLGAAWREVRDGIQFDRVLRMITAITQMGAEVCCTLGMLNAQQAERLAQAGLYAYNHNLDSSKRFYSTIITTRTYEDRLHTLNYVQEASLSICCGGIIGMGETLEDRLELIQTLANRQPHPESVPINILTPIPGTPLESQSNRPTIWEMIRLVATTRLAMPRTMVRLSCGRKDMALEQQTLCLLAGANSIFSGEKLLTTPNLTFEEDQLLFDTLGLRKRPPFKKAVSICF